MNRIPPEHEITVAICTFRRQSITAALESIASLRLDDGISVHVIVANNDDFDTVRDDIKNCALAFGLNMTYIHAPARNISIARNACIAACKSRWLAFIDDDELADPDWLSLLLREKNHSHFVFGPCEAVYPPDAPNWMREADIHSNRMTSTGAPWNGYTSNVLMDLNFVRRHELQFSESLGQTGGEDTYFFFLANERGGKFAYCSEARVFEPVTEDRLTFSWAARRRFRSGQIHYLLLTERKKHSHAQLAAILKVLYCFASAPFYGRRWRQPILRGLLHAGVVAKSIGAPIYVEYASTKSKLN